MLWQGEREVRESKAGESILAGRQRSERLKGDTQVRGLKSRGSFVAAMCSHISDTSESETCQQPHPPTLTGTELRSSSAFTWKRLPAGPRARATRA